MQRKHSIATRLPVPLQERRSNSKYFDQLNLPSSPLSCLHQSHSTVLWLRLDYYVTFYRQSLPSCECDRILWLSRRWLYLVYCTTVINSLLIFINFRMPSSLRSAYQWILACAAMSLYSTAIHVRKYLLSESYNAPSAPMILTKVEVSVHICLLAFRSTWQFRS